MDNLLEFVELLNYLPQAGKKIALISTYEFRQLIYKKHRIIYSYHAKNVVILAILHTRLDMKNDLEKFINDIK